MVELDADRALARWIGERRAALKQIVGRGTYLDDDDIDSLLRLAFPGVDELIGLLELTRLAEAGQYPEVVVDTAPTGHTLRLLGMPASLRRIAGILEQMQAKHRYLSESLAGRYRLDGSDVAIGEIEARGEGLEALLRDPRRCSFHWITLPEAVAIEEAQDGIAALAASGIAVKELVVNRVTSLPRGECPVCAARVACEEPIIARARTLFPGIPVRLLPTLSDEPRGPVLLRQVGRGLRRSSGLPSQRRPPAARSRHRAILPARDVRGGDDWLSAIAPPGVRLLLFAGKGGVGKTTCAASVAVSLADRAPDRSVLLLSTDPAHSLGDVLATPLDDVARPVPGGPPGLRARELDAGALFASRRRRYLDAVDRVFADLRGGSRFDLAFDRAVVEDLVDLAPPGIDELLGLLAITDVLMPGASGDPQSMVIVDTAPTGHVLRLLAMPATGLEWVHALMGLLLKYRKVIGLGQLGTDLVDVSRELRQLQALLTDRRGARLVVVTRAAELARLETRRLVTGVNALEDRHLRYHRQRADAGRLCPLPPHSRPRAAHDRHAAKGPPPARDTSMRYHRCSHCPAAASRGGGTPALAKGMDDTRRVKIGEPATYVYCAVRAGRRPTMKRGLRGLPGAEPPRLLDVGEQLWLVVATAPVAQYGAAPIERRLQDLDWVSRCAMAHEAVVEDAARSGPVVPMKLFTLFSSDDRAVAHIVRTRKKLARLFELVAGREEWGVRVSVDERVAARRRAEGARPAKSASGTGFLLRKKAEKDAARLAIEEALSEGERIFSELAGCGRRRATADTRPEQYRDSRRPRRGLPGSRETGADVPESGRRAGEVPR